MMHDSPGVKKGLLDEPGNQLSESLDQHEAYPDRKGG